MTSSASRNVLKSVAAMADENMSAPLFLSDNKPVKICVAGSGAIGGTLAARLALAGHDVSVIARGGHLDAIRSSGLQLIEGVSTLTAEVKAADRASFGVQDIIFVSVKAHGMKDMLPLLAP